MDQGFFSGVVTPITAAEILVKPLTKKRLSIADRYRMAIRSLPDMFQAAVALSFPARTLITNDRALRKVREVRILLLDELSP